jgi:hypothetical protein
MALTKISNTVVTLAAADVGLGNVTNESKATILTSPAITGTPTGITATHVGLGNVTDVSADGQIIALRESTNIASVWTKPFTTSETWTSIFSATYPSSTYPVTAIASNGNTIAVGYREPSTATAIIKIYV